MMPKTRMLGLCVGLVLGGVFAGFAGAQIIEDFTSRFLNTGLFTVGSGEGVNFHVSLDDRRAGPPARVLLRLFDAKGAVVARQEAVLEPGQSSTLQFRQPGLF